MFGPYSRIDEVVGFVYAADLHCHGCIEAAFLGTVRGLSVSEVEAALRAILERDGIDPSDEYGWDSDDYPKPVFDHHVHDACDADECWDRCGECGEPLGDACYAAEVWERQGENDGV